MTRDLISTYQTGATNDTGSVLKTTFIYPVASILMIGVLLAQYIKLLTLLGSIDFESLLYRRTDKLLQSGLTPASTLNQRISNVVTGALDFAGSVKKDILHTLSGALDFTGATYRALGAWVLATIYTGRRMVIQIPQLRYYFDELVLVEEGIISRTFTGAITAVGELTKQINSTWTGALSNVGQLYKTVSTTFAGSLVFWWLLLTI
jgi:hypothetical protein